MVLMKILSGNALQETYEEQHGTGDEAGFLKYLDNHYNDLLEKYQVKQVY